MIFMRSFRNLSLRKKLITISMLTAVIVLFLTVLSLLIVETIKSKNLAIDKLSSIGHIVCLHSGAALTFNDTKTADATLAAISTEPSILYASLYDEQGRVFASYKRASSSAGFVPRKIEERMHLLQNMPDKEKVLFQKDGFHLLLPVVVSQEIVGSLYIHAGLSLFYDRLYTYLILLVTISLLALLIAYLLSAQLQKTISTPIQKLADTMVEVSKNKQYSVQLKYKGSNEISLLYQSFNNMLQEIDGRDRDLLLTQYSMDHASDGICWIDEQGKITNASLGACKLIKSTKEQVLQLTIFQVWEKLSQKKWIKFWQEIDASQGVHFAIDLLTKEGDNIPVEGSCHAVHLQQKLCCMLFRDVSEKKTMELQLERSQKLEAMGILVGGVAHDLNNILSALTSYPELLLLDLPEDSKLRVPLQTIETSGLKAAAIVEDMLTLTRRNKMVMKVIDLNHSILEYLQSPEYEKLLEYHSNIVLETDLTEEIDLITASPVHMAKCIMNLISNGVEAMVTGGKLEIRTKNIFLENELPGYGSIEKGNYVVLQVTDSGVGISEEDLLQIYDPFYTKKKMGRSGTGLGMTIVWNSVTDHGGYITVETEEGSGTSFSLYFPAVSSGETCQEMVITLDDCIGNESVLVIDDVVELRTMASDMLSKLGYTVFTAASGLEAVEFLLKKKVDILVLDMIMPPGIDGLDTYRKIIETHPGQKVVIASGFAETERVKELQRLGKGLFIKKPYNLKGLGGAIRQELERTV